MYKASIRALLRHNIKALNTGDYSLMLKMASPDFELAFPGKNSWSTMFQPQQLGRERHVIHQGIPECRASLACRTLQTVRVRRHLAVPQLPE